MKISKKISIDHVIDAAKDDDGTGFCVVCGEEQGGCEPDARNYMCDCCGATAVFGAEELLMMMGGF